MSVTVVVDYHNLYKACENKVRLEIVFGEIIRKAVTRQDQIHELRLFAPCYQSPGALRLLNLLQRKFGADVSSCLVLGQGPETKDAVDLEVLLWVTKNIYPGVGPDTLIFVTGDSHFVATANEVRRRGKEVKFWFVESESLSGLIREDEDFQELKIAPPVLISGPNPFLATLQKVQSGQELDEKDKERLKLINRITKDGVDNITGVSEAELVESLSQKLEVSQECAGDLLKALIALDVVRIYPSITQALCLDENSPLFEWVSALV